MEGVDKGEQGSTEGKEQTEISPLLTEECIGDE